MHKTLSTLESWTTQCYFLFFFICSWLCIMALSSSGSCITNMVNFSILLVWPSTIFWTKKDTRLSFWSVSYCYLLDPVSHTVRFWTWTTQCFLLDTSFHTANSWITITETQTDNFGIWHPTIYSILVTHCQLPEPGSYTVQLPHHAAHNLPDPGHTVKFRTLHRKMSTSLTGINLLDPTAYTVNFLSLHYTL
jgi:hypothetical protein